MKGSIRMFVGFMIAYGAVGALEVDHSASLLTQVALALAGLGIMASGVFAMKEAQ